MSYYDNFGRIDTHKNMPSSACLIVFLNSKTENQLITFFVADILHISSRQQRKT